MESDWMENCRLCFASECRGSVLGSMWCEHDHSVALPLNVELLNKLVSALPWGTKQMWTSIIMRWLISLSLQPHLKGYKSNIQTLQKLCALPGCNSKQGFTSIYCSVYKNSHHHTTWEYAWGILWASCRAHALWITVTSSPHWKADF